MGQIKGITIEIDGKTTGLTKALKAANSEIKTTKSQLNSVEKALKLDPKNVDLLKAKQNALNGVIKETKEKLDMEKQAAESAKKELELGNITQGEYDALQKLLLRRMSCRIWKSRQDRRRPCWEVRCRQQERISRKLATTYLSLEKRLQV